MTHVEMSNRRAYIPCKRWSDHGPSCKAAALQSYTMPKRAGVMGINKDGCEFRSNRSSPAAARDRSAPSNFLVESRVSMSDPGVEVWSWRRLAAVKQDG